MIRVFLTILAALIAPVVLGGIGYAYGVAALSFAGLLAIGAIVSWCVIRQPVVRYVVSGLLVLFLFGNGLSLAFSKFETRSRQAAVRALCEQDPGPRIVKRLVGIGGVLADYPAYPEAEDGPARYAGVSYPGFMLRRYLVDGPSPYRLYVQRIEKNYDIYDSASDDSSKSKRTTELPSVRVALRWEKNDASVPDGVASYDLVVIDLTNDSRLGSLRTFATSKGDITLMPSFFIGQTVAQFRSVQRCPSVGQIAAFVQGVARP